MKIEKGLEAGELRLRLENVGSVKSVGVVVCADGSTEPKFGIHGKSQARRQAERVDGRLLLLQAVGGAGNSGSVDIFPIGGGEQFRRGADGEAETGVVNGHTESAERNHAGRSTQGRVGVHGVRKGAARENGVEGKIQVTPAKESDAGGIGRERVKSIGGGSDVDAAETGGARAGSVHIKILRGSHASEQKRGKGQAERSKVHFQELLSSGLFGSCRSRKLRQRLQTALRFHQSFQAGGVQSVRRVLEHDGENFFEGQRVAIGTLGA